MTEDMPEMRVIYTCATCAWSGEKVNVTESNTEVFGEDGALHNQLVHRPVCPHCHKVIPFHHTTFLFEDASCLPPS